MERKEVIGELRRLPSGGVFARGGEDKDKSGLDKGIKENGEGSVERKDKQTYDEEKYR